MSARRPDRDQVPDTAWLHGVAHGPCTGSSVKPADSRPTECVVKFTAPGCLATQRGNTNRLMSSSRWGGSIGCTCDWTPGPTTSLMRYRRRKVDVTTPTGLSHRPAANQVIHADNGIEDACREIGASNQR